MGKQWVREQVRRDPVQDSVDKGVRWVDDNRQFALGAAGAGVCLLLLAVLLISHARSTRIKAWDRLGLAEAMAYAGQPDASLQQLKQLTEEQPGSAAAGFGRVFAADISYSRGQYKDALDGYNAVLERGKPAGLQPIALNDVAISQEAAGQFEQAQQAAQRFLELYPDHFLAPQVHACLARSLAALGQLDKAKTTYQKIALQYEGTPWAAWANARLQSSK